METVPLIDLFFCAVFFCLLLSLPVVIFSILFYYIVIVGRKGMSACQAKVYWREKFKDETLLYQQRETLLRASKETQAQETLLRPISKADNQEKLAEQLVRSVDLQR